MCLRLFMLLLLAHFARPGVGQAASPRYNFVVIVTDDQRWDTLTREVMPITWRKLVDRGIVFTEAFVTTPTCCPSRASFLSGGYYPHNVGVVANGLPNGGARRFKDLRALPVLVQGAGYRTGLIGKYLNGYEAMAPYVPPGWTGFVSNLTSPSWTSYQVVRGRSIDGPSAGRVESHTEYLTTLQQDEALAFLRRYGDRPFFLYLATNAPHLPATPANQHDLARFEDYRYRDRGYGETDVADKPAVMRLAASAFDPGTADEWPSHQLASLQAVDRTIGALIAELERQSLLERTVIVFTSDNGYLWGEHRLTGKSKPYEEAIRVPLVIRAPEAAPRHDDHLVIANLDVARTLLDFAGVDAATDGVSLRPLLDGEAVSWREELLIENSSVALIWAGIRTRRWKYVEYPSGERELYDLEADPYELESEHSNPTYSPLLSQFAQRLENWRGLAVTTPKRLPAGTVGQPYAVSLEAWGGKPPYRWTVGSGSLPDGLFLDRSGDITGVPERPQVTRFSVRVKDSLPVPYSEAPQSFQAPLRLVVRKGPATQAK